MEERETEVESEENGGRPMIQWHPAFVAALEMEFRENSGDLLFEREYNLSRKPLQIDCLIIKKHDGAVLRNEIGKLFLRHNVVEYKSPRDGLTIDDLAMTQAYAYLYKAHGRRVNEIKLGEISVTLVREAAPEGLFKELEEGGCAVRRAYDGISRANANVVMELAREDKVVYNELLELFQPEIDKQVRETAERVGRETEKRDIAATIKIARRFGGGDTEIREELMSAYNLTEEEAVAYLGSGV